jgi:hypothetical protein
LFFERNLLLSKYVNYFDFVPLYQVQVNVEYKYKFYFGGVKK